MTRTEALEEVARVARRVMLPRVTLGEFAGSAVECIDSSRCLCGCDGEVEALRAALAALDRSGDRAIPAMEHSPHADDCPAVGGSGGIRPRPGVCNCGRFYPPHPSSPASPRPADLIEAKNGRVHEEGRSRPAVAVRSPASPECRSDGTDLGRATCDCPEHSKDGSDGT